ncbi:unnamed protein product [Leptosia nina]|uniref:Uncharacterized protein n=1 Tax=Leptosia nina TaxID=320188 RepID=A0AAV1K2V4_9NEOP
MAGLLKLSIKRLLGDNEAAAFAAIGVTVVTLSLIVSASYMKINIVSTSDFLNNTEDSATRVAVIHCTLVQKPVS